METRTLPCHLTETELLERGSKIADLLDKKTSIDGEKKRFNDDVKSKAGELDATIASLSAEVRTKTEYRSVEVKREKNYERRVEEIIRLDTGELVETRALSPGELQTRLAFSSEVSAQFASPCEP